MIKKFILLIASILPWSIKKIIYRFYGFKIGKNSYVGISWLSPEKMILSEGSRIGSFTICKNISLLELGKNSRIGSLNWITGYPLLKEHNAYFLSEKKRNPCLIIGDESAITARHYIDCTSQITIGSYSTVAGIRSQFLTHSIDINISQQVSDAIAIGDYCFVGTGCIFIKGSSIPNYSVIGAGSMINSKEKENFVLYGGSPAKKIKKLDQNAKYFNRTRGVV
jgi:acetyltransferase-like isoleucine patch superfamily enzyme